MVSKKNSNSIFFEYINLYKKYRDEYGNNTIVLMMVGMFYEMYSLNDEDGPDLTKLSSMLNILCSRKNKNITSIDSSNPYMVGFPVHTLDKYINILVKNYKYTIIIVDQFDNEMGKNSKKDRKVVDIISPSTYINEICDYKSNYLMSIYFYKILDRKTKKNNLYFAIGLIELSIGKVYLYEDYNKDDKLFYDNLYRIILKYNPKEIVLFGDDIDYNIIKKNINFDNYCVHNKIDNYNKNINDNVYQTEILKKVYTNTGMLNVIEYINLERNPELLITFINLIEFTYSHNERIIERIHKPEFLDKTNELILGYNLIKKLDIVSNDNNKYSSLLNILNNCSTNIGKRYFEKNLLNPLTNIDIINKRYDNVELMLKKFNIKFLYEIFRENLKNICDLERFFRKIFLLKLQPQEFITIIQSINVYYKILKDFESVNKEIDITGIISFKKEKKMINNLLKKISDVLNVDMIHKFNFDNINGHIFVEGKYDDIDNMQKDLDENIKYFEDICKEYNSISKDFKSFFKVEYNDNIGFHLQITVNRFNIFKRKYDKDKIDDITTKKLSASSSIYRVFLEDFKERNEKITELNNEIRERCVEKYKVFCKKLYNEQIENFTNIIKNIENIDYTCNNAYNSIMYKYCKPNIVSNDKSYLDMKQVRHPIIEIINEDIKYITNDISLGKEDDGILLYGMNSAGKSSLMKSIGLNIIMAQAGMYVACKNMTYMPYNKIFCRIPGGDDIFKGHSTFVSEISEIRNILKSSDENTLVIGDELCSGTETNSAISIVSAGIISLIEKRTSFIFATHLHELSIYERIKNIEKLSIKHLSVEYIEGTNILKFDRRLKDGAGESIYGLEVCKSLDLEDKFINLATEIRQEVMGINILLKNKKSRYNSKIILDKCNVCKDNEAVETHHIRFQRDADENGYIEHFHKNKKFNLLCVCEECHNKIHNNEIIINEAFLTSEGIRYT